MPASRLPAWLVPSAPVRAALRQHRPVVALETAVLTHGFPRAESLPLARTLEATVRRAGAVPAFLALLDGKARVGLTAAELEKLCAADAAKCARADLGWLVAQRASAGTTVSATLHLAAAAGIAVAATGGIGGVHRDAAETFDVSADLLELARQPVTLVCSGAKAVVDLRKTLEFLASQSVPVIGFATPEFPGFYLRQTGLALNAVARDLGELVAIVRSTRRTGYAGGLLVANPIPAKAALTPGEVERLVQQALKRAVAAGITGPALTPFLLESLNELSGGATLRANRALLASNAELAARLAVALARRQRR